MLIKKNPSTQFGCPKWSIGDIVAFRPSKSKDEMALGVIESITARWLQENVNGFNKAIPVITYDVVISEKKIAKLEETNIIGKVTNPHGQTTDTTRQAFQDS